MPLQALHGVSDAVDWLVQRGARSLCADSRRLRPGDAFIAWPGQAHDARVHVRDALAAGAVACLVEADGADAHAFDDALPIAAMAGLKAASGPVASEFLGRPSEQLRLVAVTGTNGKTSTTWWIAQALAALGQRCAVVGTLGVGVPPQLQPTGLTTPDPVQLQGALRGFVDRGIGSCAIEASSIGIEEQRLAGCRIDTAAFTNFTQDHLDYHGDMAAYWRAKRRLFDWPGLRAAVVNLGDGTGRALADELGSRGGLDVWTCAIDGHARLSARGVQYRDGGLAFELVESGESHLVRSSLVGEFNLANMLVVAGVLRAQGVALGDVASACAALGPVPGRMQRVEADGEADASPLVVVDYAHTPDALEKVLQALQPLAASRGGALWCVFGCGGNRDRAKRPLMAAAAERLAQRIVVTSDNPRREEPASIIADIVGGLVAPQRATVLADRREAIAHAVRSADPADVVLIAGKGHEDYQEIGSERLPFSDAAVAQQVLGAAAGRDDQGTDR